VTPVTQTIFFEPDRPHEKQRGNCLSAVVASLLDVPIEAVPNFVQIDVAGGPNWWWLLWRYLELMGKRLCTVSPRTPPAGVFYTVGGLSARATEDHPIHHICVYRDGRIVHDPHPERPRAPH
jgi:hypothetical protein